MDPVAMAPYAARPWTAQYASAAAASAFAPRHPHALALFEAAVARDPQAPAIRYFDGSLSHAELDAQAEALAAWLAAQGFVAGDRLALYLQNTPGFVIGLLAAWKLGGIAVTMNPMNRERELGLLLADCRPRALLCHRGLHANVVAKLPVELRERLCLITTDETDFQRRNDARLLEPARPHPPETADLMTVLATAGRDSVPLPRPQLRPEDIATIVYTSGTTGLPKGALNTHGNIAFNAELYRVAIGLRDGGPILGLAPLFHITGLVGHIGAAFACAAPLILSCRFHPDVMAEAIAEHNAEFAIGAITAWIALMNRPEVRREQLDSLRQVYSGGAPIPLRVVEQFRSRFGHTIRNGYGLTETTSPATLVPPQCEGPYDTGSAALSIGVPVFGTDCCIVDDAGEPVPVGSPGEILIRGPQVVPGYWQRPEANREAFHDGWLRSGDIGFMDQDGWFFLIDRKKDMINAAGFKVWPREVEEVLYLHAAVREAAVVGIADDYRGETVKAVVSLKAGQAVTAEALIAHCREQLAAYKVPRRIDFLDELPKTVTGKILRRALR